MADRKDSEHKVDKPELAEAKSTAACKLKTTSSGVVLIKARVSLHRIL